MTALSNGDLFPTLSIDAVGGGTISLPADMSGAFGVVLIYRGSWCPFCNAQLAGFSQAADRFSELGIKVVALSVDDEATSAALVEKHHVGFPVGHSADARAVAAATGAQVNDDPLYLQPAGFVLAPDGRVITAAYSTGPLGRLVADDVITLVGYAQSQA